MLYCKGKGKGLDTCPSAAYMSQTRDQQHFTISEVADDWHEPMVPQRIMWPSIASANRQRTAFMTMGLDRTYHAHRFIFSFTF